MKKFLTIIILSSTIFTMTACQSTIVSDVEDGYTDKQQTTFERHKLDDQYSILVDKDTGVCYLEHKSESGYAGYYGLTVLLNADGTPKIWKD